MLDLKQTTPCTTAFSERMPPKLRTGFLLGLLIALFSTTLPGCVHRRLTIRSDPPGALVLLDGEEVGYTPYSGDFTYYGTREITLIKNGYETLTTLQTVPAPWYQHPPFDLIADNLLPGKVTNRHDFTYGLQPQVGVRTEELIDRAESLRSDAQVGQ